MSADSAALKMCRRQRRRKEPERKAGDGTLLYTSEARSRLSLGPEVGEVEDKGQAAQACSSSESGAASTRCAKFPGHVTRLADPHARTETRNIEERCQACSNTSTDNVLYRGAGKINEPRLHHTSPQVDPRTAALVAQSRAALCGAATGRHCWLRRPE